MIPSIMFFAAFSLAVPVPDVTEEELKRIGGEWVVVKMAWQGEPWQPIGRSAAIDRDDLSLRDRKGAARYKIKRIKSGQIDLVKETLPAIGEVHLGIYSLDGDSLKICIDLDGQSASDPPPKRPAKYESPKGSSCIVYFLERKKEAKKDNDK